MAGNPYNHRTMSEDDQVKVDAIVVGGGPAGLAAALTMAQEGLEVMVSAGNTSAPRTSAACSTEPS